MGHFPCLSIFPLLFFGNPQVLCCWLGIFGGKCFCSWVSDLFLKFESGSLKTFKQAESSQKGRSYLNDVQLISVAEFLLFPFFSTSGFLSTFFKDSESLLRVIHV